MYFELDIGIKMCLLNLLVQLYQGMDGFFIIYYNRLLVEYLKEVHVCLEVSLIYKDLIIKLKLPFKHMTIISTDRYEYRIIKNDQRFLPQ